MLMTPEEIAREYRLSKTPQKQIGILADLNQCSKAVIKQILTDTGCKLPGNMGKRATVPTEATVPTISTEKLPGAKSDAGKLDLTLVPPEIITAVAEIRRYGNQKYADSQNWRSVDPMKLHKALIRHAVAMWEDPWAVDPESGMPHLWHLATNAAFLCAMMPEMGNDK